MLHRIMPTNLQDTVEAYHVWLDIGIEILNTITHTSLSCKIHHHCWLILTKYIIDIATVSNINFLVIDIVNANNGSSFHISKQSLY